MVIPSEHDEQVALVRSLRAQGCLVFAIPNGGLRDAITAKRLKDEGVLSGSPDLCIVLPDGKTLWVEMKRRKGGTTSPEQKAIHLKMTDMGHQVIVGHGAKDASEQIMAALGKKKATV